MKVNWSIPKSSLRKKAFSWNYQKKIILKYSLISVVILGGIIIFREFKLDELYISADDLLVIPIFTLLLLIISTLPLFIPNFLTISQKGILIQIGHTFSTTSGYDGLLISWVEINDLVLTENGRYLELCFIYDGQNIKQLAPFRKKNKIEEVINLYHGTVSKK